MECISYFDIFDTTMAQRILQVPIVHSQEPDLLRWKPATSGDCTTKEAFEILNQQVTTPIPSHGARRITSHTLDLFKRIWRHKTIPPRIKTFSWRLLRQALATGSMPGRFTKHINQNCQLCGKMDFTRAFFWFGADPRFVRTSSRMRTMLFRNPSLTSFLEELTMTRYTKSLPTFGIFGKQEMTTGLIIRNGP